LDAPASGVTAAFLYGSAIWPVFLSQRFGDDIVRSVLEQEAQRGDSAIAATDTVLQAMQSSIADEFSLFAAWNSATGARAGTGGYEHAMDYPEVAVSELSNSGSKAITSGLASFYYHARADGPLQVLLDTDQARNRGVLLPFEDGLPRVDRLAPLPAELNVEGIVVVSGITTSKKDAPFTVSLAALTAAPAASAQNTGGCALSGSAPRPRLPVALSLPLMLVSLFAVKRTTRRERHRLA
jgi:hypothetical protein